MRMASSRLLIELRLIAQYVYGGDGTFKLYSLAIMFLLPTQATTQSLLGYLGAQRIFFDDFF